MTRDGSIARMRKVQTADDERPDKLCPACRRLWARLCIERGDLYGLAHKAELEERRMGSATARTRAQIAEMRTAITYTRRALADHAEHGNE